MRHSHPAVYPEKSDIIGLIAHDLRAPLTAAVELGGEITAAPEDPRNVANPSALPTGSHRQMVELTQPLLDIEAIASGTMRTKEGVIDLAALFSDLPLGHTADIERKALRIDSNLTASRIAWQGSVLLLQRVAENLFPNAMK